MNIVLFRQDLRLSSISIRHEILNCQKRWFEELAGLGEIKAMRLTMAYIVLIFFFTSSPALKFQFNFQQDKTLRWLQMLRKNIMQLLQIIENYSMRSKN